MGADQLRTTLIQQIQNGDESFLRVVSAVADAYRQEHTQAKTDQQITGYRAGKEMTIQELKNRVATAEDQIDRGDYLTPEELEKGAEEWLSSTE